MTSDGNSPLTLVSYRNVTAHSVGGEGFPTITDKPPYYISELHCNGSEDRVDNCVQNAIEQNDCSDSDWFWSTPNSRIYVACDPQSKVVSTGKYRG